VHQAPLADTPRAVCRTRLEAYPIHLQGAFEDMGYKEGDLPVAGAAAKDLSSLPMYPGIARA
jgi:dTDP-4-amino-4,6-dideoxygalactose transaminase